MAKITESDIEELAIDLLEAKGYQYLYGPDIAPDSENPLRESFDEVVLKSKLESAIDRINPNIPIAARQDALKQILRTSSPETVSANEEFHKMLTKGVNVTYQKDGVERGDLVWLVDFEEIENNEFLVVNQFTVSQNHQNKRPDVILFINGLPLVVIELKNAADENATIKSAYKQIQTYKEVVPSLFNYNGAVVISDGLDAKAGSLTASFSRFMAWKSADGDKEASRLIGQLETLINGMLNKRVILDLIRNFIVFEKSSSFDPDTKITTISTVKKLAAYHQYYAVNKAVDSVSKAATSNGDRKGGVIWHTQGSGKSLSMVFTAAKLVMALDNPTILVITDRNDLDDQLFGTFGNCIGLLRQTPIQAKNRDHIKELLKVSGGGVIFTTIQKFSPEEGNVYDTLSERTNIVVVADEAHRSQYGFKGRLVEVEDGSEIRYGNAKYMRDALPNASYIGFTGTPIEKEDKSTPAVFGGYIDIYDIKQAVDDGATVPISYEARLVKIKLDKEVSSEIDALVEEISDTNEDQIEKIVNKIKKWR